MTQNPPPVVAVAKDDPIALAPSIADVLLQGFNKHYTLFRASAKEARRRFEAGDWKAVQAISRERIQFYDKRVQEAVDRLKSEFDIDALPDRAWPQVKLHYIGMLTRHKQPECAETFFNSVVCKLLHRNYFHNDIIFVRPTISTEHLDGDDPPTYRSYYPRQTGLKRALWWIIGDFGFGQPFANLRRDFRYVLRALRQHFPRPMHAEANLQIQVLSSLFIRNKGAYIIGKAINGHQEYPFAVPILHDAKHRLFIDTILLDPHQIRLLFNFSRAYFMVDLEVPAAYVQFLRSFMPAKSKGELYNMLGLAKHGKTLFYRDLLQHLRHSSDQFVVAPGIRGMVMMVFTLPSFPYVFKLIRDRFAPQKEVNRQTVIDKYRLVKYHDRVGRLADTLEFSDVALPKERFSPALLAELYEAVPSLLEEDGDTLVIKHLYIERRMEPLNLYLSGASPDKVEHGIVEFGNAIKELAAANIFPGDMMFKNFGVTRDGRVIFYDYDEILYMTECNFRNIPPARSYEDELSAEPYYGYMPNDVFPEELARFLLVDPVVRSVFLRHHPDLFTTEWWLTRQKRIEDGHIEDVFPYPEALRFRQQFGRPAGSPALVGGR